MKTVIAFLLIWSFAFNCLAQTNVYYPFPSNNAMWSEQCGGYQNDPCEEYQYLITGDSIIAGKVFHKIQKTGLSFILGMNGLCDFLNPVGHINKYMGAYRNDSTNKKVYFIKKDSQSEVLLYDFNLYLSDTLPPSYGNTSQCFQVNCIVTDDSILIGNKYRRRLGIGDCSGFGSPFVYLIEGIGSTYGLLGFICPQFEWGSDLRCFQQNGMTVYPDTNYICSIITGYDENNRYFDSDVIIVPNPILDDFAIKFPQNVSQNCSEKIFYEIYSEHGVVIFSGIIFGGETIIKDLENYQPGVYLLRIKTETKIICIKKIIKLI